MTIKKDSPNAPSEAITQNNIKTEIIFKFPLKLKNSINAINIKDNDSNWINKTLTWLLTKKKTKKIEYIKGKKDPIKIHIKNKISKENLYKNDLLIKYEKIFNHNLLI